MDFYTVILRQSASYWVALCLENGIVGQGQTQDHAVEKLREAIASLQDVSQLEPNVQSSAISIQELHEFLTIESKEPIAETYEFRAVYA